MGPEFKIAGSQKNKIIRKISVIKIELDNEIVFRETHSRNMEPESN